MAKERNRTRTTAANQAARSAERRKEREREKQRQRLITGGIIVVGLVALAVFIFLIVNAPAEAPIPEAAQTRYDDLQQSRTDDGYFRLGSPNAPVQVAEYSSFDCTHCREFHDETIDGIVERVRSGGIAFTYVPLYGFGSVANGLGAAAAAVCAGQQGEFWTFHDALFDWQGVYGNQAFTNNRIQTGIDNLGLDRSRYNSCLASGETSDTLNTARAEASALLNFVGTPTITINGVVPLDENQQPLTASDAILARIDAEIARVQSLRVTPTEEATSEATIDATDEPTDAPTEAPTEEPTPEVTTES